MVGTSLSDKKELGIRNCPLPSPPRPPPPPALCLRSTEAADRRGPAVQLERSASSLTNPCQSVGKEALRKWALD